MGKSNVVREIEIIATRIYNQKMRENQFLVRLGTWVKVLQDENREMKKQIAELEIRLKKLNDYGPTLLTRREEKTRTESNNQQRLTPGELKSFRMSRKLSQNALAAMLGVKAPKYARWESGKSRMTMEIENAIRELMQLKASEMRTKLQGLGLFQNTGKKTKPLRGQELPVPEKEKSEKQETPKPNAKRILKEIIITKEKLRELRLRLGYTQPQMAGLFSAKPKHYANWEYGQCRPPEEIARKYLALYLEHFPEAQQQTLPTTPPQLPERQPKYRICESPELPMLVIRTARQASGRAVRSVAEALGIPVQTYKNWEYGRSRPNAENIIKFKQLFAHFLPAEFTTSEVNPLVPDISQIPTQARRTQRTADDIVAEELQAFRRKIGLSQQQIATLLGTDQVRYSNWETKGRKVPLQYRDAVKELMALTPQYLKIRMEAAGITEMQGRPFQPRKKGNK